MISIIYTTFKTEHNAKELAIKMLNEKLAFCVNMIPKVTSFYISGTEIQNSEEVVLIVKTMEKYEDALIRFISKHHSYDTPFVAKIASVSHDKCNNLYVNWVKTLELSNIS